MIVVPKFYFIVLPYIVLVHGLSTVVMDTAFCMVLEIAKSSYDLQLTILSYRILYHVLNYCARHR